MSASTIPLHTDQHLVDEVRERMRDRLSTADLAQFADVPMDHVVRFVVAGDPSALSGQVRKFVGGHAAAGWSVWRSSRCRKSFRSVVVNFHLNAVAVWL